MADFAVTIASEATTTEWEDLGSPTFATRLNSPRYSHRYYKIGAGTLELKALVAGAEVADAGLGGRLFSWGWSHYGNGPVPGFVTPAGESFNPSAIFTESNTGLWLVRCTRPESGAILIGACLELPP